MKQPADRSRRRFLKARPASPATRLRKIATLSSPITHLDAENEILAARNARKPTSGVCSYSLAFFSSKLAAL